MSKKNQTTRKIIYIDTDSIKYVDETETETPSIIEQIAKATSQLRKGNNHHGKQESNNQTNNTRTD